MKTTILYAILNLLLIQGYNQYNKTIEFQSQNVTIKEILNKLDSIEEVKLSYNHVDLPLNKTVRLDKTEYSIEVLLEILSQNNIDFQKLDKHIILKKVEKTEECKILDENSIAKEPESDEMQEEKNENESLDSKQEFAISAVLPGEIKAKSDKKVIENVIVNDGKIKDHSFANYENNDTEENKENKKLKINYGIIIGGKISDMNFRTDYFFDITEESFNLKPGYEAGIVANTYFYKKLIFQTGLVYSTKGVNYSNIKQSEFYYATSEYKVRTHYAELPISIKYNMLSGSLHVCPIIGMYMAYGFYGRIKMKTDIYNDVVEDNYPVLWKKGAYYDFYELNMFNDLKRFDFGLATGLDFEYNDFILGLSFKPGLRKLPWEGEVHNVTYEINITYLIF